MSVPATTGVLRTQISDMEIGDYIACKYVAASGVVGVFSELGTSVATEIPVAGSATPNGSFYLVKVGKGLLIADRNVQHSISWDVLNKGKLMQGMSLDLNIIPTMTSYTTPSGVVSASSEINGTSRSAYKAFDKVLGGNAYWSATTPRGWIQYQFDSPEIIKKYTLIMNDTSQVNAQNNPMAWTFEGSNNGVNWTELSSEDLFTTVNNISLGVFSYEINNTLPFTYYRLNISRNQGGSYVSLAEITMSNVTGTIRSLTGGVAYADENGNSSTTDKGFGAFPTNNEWDKYLVNFPVGKIQSGKTLDDVFHWNNITTWCQETPILTIGVSSSRVARGLTAITNNMRFNSSGTASTVFGFRPVFEYRE